MSDPAPPQGPYQPPGSPYQQPPAPPYQQPPAPPYQQPPAQPYGGGGGFPGMSGMGGGSLASYGQRVGAYLIDVVIYLVAALPGWLLYTIGSAAANDGDGGGVLFIIGAVLLLAAALFSLWNMGWRQGATGQSIGKGVMKIKLVRAADGVPPGGGIGLARIFIRAILGSVTCGVYSLVTLLWPLWDQRRQTLDDKILSTLVVEAR